MENLEIIGEKVKKTTSYLRMLSSKKKNEILVKVADEIEKNKNEIISANKIDIENAIKDAEKYADEDKKRKEAVEVKNTADSMLYQTKKTLDDLGDKVSNSDRNAIEDAKKALEDSLKSDDTELIKSNTEALQKCLYDMTEKMYNSVKGDVNNNQDEYVGGADDDYIDADFTEVN